MKRKEKKRRDEKMREREEIMRRKNMRRNVSNIMIWNNINLDWINWIKLNMIWIKWEVVEYYINNLLNWYLMKEKAKKQKEKS